MIGKILVNGMSYSRDSSPSSIEIYGFKTGKKIEKQTHEL